MAWGLKDRLVKAYNTPNCIAKLTIAKSVMAGSDAGPARSADSLVALIRKRGDPVFQRAILHIVILPLSTFANASGRAHF